MNAEEVRPSPTKPRIRAPSPSLFLLTFLSEPWPELGCGPYHNVNNDRALRIFVVIFPAQPFGSLIPHSWEQPANGLSAGQVATIPSDLLCQEEAAPGSVSWRLHYHRVERAASGASLSTQGFHSSQDYFMLVCYVEAGDKGTGLCDFEASLVDTGSFRKDRVP